MRRKLSRWLPPLNAHSMLVVAAAATLIGTAAAAGATEASSSANAVAAAAVAGRAAAPQMVTVMKPKDEPRPTQPAAPPPPPSVKELAHSFELQHTYYNCGPAATRVALSAQGKLFTEDEVGQMLGTTQNGTDSAINVTQALNSQLGPDRYHTYEIPAYPATPDDIGQFKTNVVNAIARGDVVVANIAGTMYDNAGELHSYEGGHYLAIVGYSDSGDNVEIADSADTIGSPYYTMPVSRMADWIATRGYSA
jgi:peptidase C39-like protein